MDKHDLNLQQELISTKYDTLKLLDDCTSMIEKLEKELLRGDKIKDENITLKKEIVKMKTELEELKKENVKLKNLKMYKITKKYWILRKIISIRGSR